MKESSLIINYGLLKSFASKELKKELYFPLGINISVNGENFSIRSKINEYLKIYVSDVVRFTKDDEELKKCILAGFCSEKLLDYIITEKVFPLYNLLEDEISVIEEIFRIKGNDYSPSATRELIEKDYGRYVAEISLIFDNYIKTRYKEELYGLFLKSIDKDEKRGFFRIVNYLIHFINWDNQFYNFYDSSLEIISGVIREVETYLSPALITSIKAYRAYHNHINVHERFLEKREKGRISSISVLDWNSNIKELLTCQFDNIFGRIKATEYITCLDNILKKEIENVKM